MFDVNWMALDGKKSCTKTQLILTSYKTVDNKKRIVPAQSHYRLWKQCVHMNEPHNDTRT